MDVRGVGGMKWGVEGWKDGRINEWTEGSRGMKVVGEEMGRKGFQGDKMEGGVEGRGGRDRHLSLCGRNIPVLQLNVGQGR